MAWVLASSVSQTLFRAIKEFAQAHTVYSSWQSRERLQNGSFLCSSSHPQKGQLGTLNFTILLGQQVVYPGEVGEWESLNSDKGIAEIFP